MASFPTELVEHVEILNGRHVGLRGAAALKKLRENDFYVGVGLTEHFIEDLHNTSRQNHVQKYCPQDSTEARFATKDSIKQWLKKGGGRGTADSTWSTKGNFSPVAAPFIHFAIGLVYGIHMA